MKKLSYLLLLFLVHGSSFAAGPCSDGADEVCIFWSADCDECFNCASLDHLERASLFVVLMNPSEPSGIAGYNFQLVDSEGTLLEQTNPDFIFVQYFYPYGGVNTLPFPQLHVGTATPLIPESCVLLIQLNIVSFGENPWCIGVAPLSGTRYPEYLGYYRPGDWENPIPMNPCTGPDAPDFAMACANDPDCGEQVVPTEESSWGGLKALYR